MQANIQIIAELAGISLRGTTTRTAPAGISYSPETPLPAAATGDLTTRTDDNTGIVTLDEGHSIVTGKVDVYWDGGLRYGMDGTVTVNSLTIDGGEGDALPAKGTAVTVANQVSVAAAFDGDNVKALGIQFERRGNIDIREAAASALAREQPAGEVFEWTADSDVTNPLAAKDVATFELSNGDSAGTSTVKVGILLDNDG